MRTMKHWAIAAMTATALALAGCGGGGSPQAVGPTDAEKAEMARQAQITVVNDALVAANAAVQALDVSSDSNAIEAAQGLIDTAEAEIDKLPAADQTSFDDQLMAVQSHHDTAEQLAAAEQEKTDAAARRTAQMGDVDSAIEAAEMAVEALSEDSTAEQIAAAKVLVDAIQTAIDAGADLTQPDIVAYTGTKDGLNTSIVTTEGLVAARMERDETQRQMDVASARSAAMQSYMDADADATKAETAATEAEKTATGSPGAVAARGAATAARMAATNAKAALDGITDGMSKADADAQAHMAAVAAGQANSSYMTAKAENDTIQTASIIGEQQQEVRDLAAAREDAGMYADEVKGHYDAAKGKAMDARAQAVAARAAANKAKAARTDYANADKYAKMAEAEATKAETARASAMAAHMAAEAARTAADNAETSMEARAEANKAKAQNVIATEAHTGDTGAGMAYMAASDAAAKAQEAAPVHVLGLLMHANGTDITTVGDPADVDVAKALADAREARVDVTTAALTLAAGEDDNGEDGTTATATWPGVPDDPDTDATNEAAGSVLSIAVSPEGATALRFTPEAIPDDPDTDGTDESMTKTATAIDGLGGFDGYSISDGTQHAIVFTDKTQDDAPVTAVTGVPAANLVNDPVSGSIVTDLGARSGTGYTGVTYYDDVDTVDDNTDTNLAFMGTLTCPDGTACSASTAANGDITVSGYVFTGSREETTAVTAMDAAAQAAANQDYLAFGVWLQEVVRGDDGTVTTLPDFGAFAAGGSAVTALAQEITGMATYKGSAAGVYTAGESVDWFEGDAELTADFGANDAQGTITGKIERIVAGGNAMSDVILLNDDGTPDDGNVATGGTFSGDARMGTATTVDAVTEYTHNGSWSGQFFNGTADDTDTTDVNESHVAPDSVAGTFGVTGMTGEGDDAVTRSYVGAFGAHKND